MSSTKPTVQMPPSDNIVKASVVATTVEAAKYFATAVKNKVMAVIQSLSMAPEEAKPLHHLVDVVENAAKTRENAQYSSQRIWTGHLPLQTAPDLGLAELAATSQAWDEKHGIHNVLIDFGFGVTDQSVFVRSYSHEGQLFDEETTGFMDGYFNSWLDTRGMVCETVEEEGAVKAYINMKGQKDANGQPVRANPSALRADIAAEFANYVKSKKSTIQVNTQDRSAELTQAVPESGAESR